MDEDSVLSAMPEDHKQNLKRQRGGAKAAVTRLMTQITTAMNCNQPKEVEMKLAALDEAVVRFSEVHDMYHKTLEDDDDLDASKGYLTSVLRDVQDFQHTALSWLDEFKPSVEDLNVDVPNFQEEISMLSVNQLTTQLQDLNKLRQREKEEFSRLISQQEERLRAEFKLQLQHAQCEMDEMKDLLKLKDAEVEESRRKVELELMNKDTSTPVSELSKQQYQSNIDSMHLPPVDIIQFDGEPLNQGYAEAMAILKRRFGNPYAISQAWVDKVLNYKHIKDNKQLQSFADILCSCRDTLKAMKCEDELNGGRTLLQIVEKLPEDIKKRWLTVNYEIVKSGRLPKLDDVVSRVESEAAKRADPIFGNLLSSISRNSPKRKAFDNFRKRLQKMKIEYALLYPATLRFTINGTVKRFASPNDVTAFIDSLG
ncbi:hypothetical protein ROHU_001856 [Labeo rohita]|uniref:Ribosome-recycling factor, mitochondrial n=1 Tax=Labeo rohita TaxID=84645 RepID=A0A498P1E2_LABRO|nr:hypothetical protein ROHU_001856 [Labeo rohita]